ncbi:MAG: family lipase [Amycolatopsis sp.]|uniref:SGNH/GDSL hydrolase family protein n=1 Tax=Amycolatopsis sp. TaxID=37632 RepID=UPI0026023327|nr:SGNH/GDSL hydrolase family protein [Amycolatopsis sp.]MCU1681210.1 family lipase [Amycolatopsis sp.]
MRANRIVLTSALAMLSLTASTLTAAAVTAAPLAPSHSSHSNYSNYVALGDSYTSGPFIPSQRLDPLGCGRSTSNYPAYLAAKLNVRSYTDVSCAGATTADMTQDQGVLLGSNDPQFTGLRIDTDLVTIGIGANDSGVFGELIATCPGLRASDPTGDPCQRHFTINGVDTAKAALAATQANITAVLHGIHVRSPQAKVLAVGYPRIAPATGYCPSVLPIADGDYAWLTEVETAINSAIQHAVATDAKSSFVDTFGPSSGHDICAGAGAAWINGQHDNIFAAAAYHPFQRGMAGVASLIYAALR